MTEFYFNTLKPLMYTFFPLLPFLRYLYKNLSYITTKNIDVFYLVIVGYI